MLNKAENVFESKICFIRGVCMSTVYVPLLHISYYFSGFHTRQDDPCYGHMTAYLHMHSHTTAHAAFWIPCTDGVLHGKMDPIMTITFMNPCRHSFVHHDSV